MDRLAFAKQNTTNPYEFSKPISADLFRASSVLGYNSKPPGQASKTPGLQPPRLQDPSQKDQGILSKGDIVESPQGLTGH